MTERNAKGGIKIAGLHALARQYDAASRNDPAIKDFRRYACKPGECGHKLSPEQWRPKPAQKGGA